MEKYSTPISYGWSSILAFFGALTLNEWSSIFGILAIIGGFLTGIGTFVVNWHYRRREDQRAQMRFERESEKS